MAPPELDAVVVGSGPNGLTAAVVLARAGLRVRVYEAEPTIGGGARTAEVTLPGFRHDLCSAVHPLGAGSPVLRSLPLAEHGLVWIEPPAALAHPLEHLPAAHLVGSVEETAATLGQDAGRYRRLVAPFVGRWDDLAVDALRPPLATLPRHPFMLTRFGLRGALPARVLIATMRDTPARTLLAGLSAHAIAPLTAPATGGVAMLFAVAGHDVGWPFPRGGSQAITDSLASYLRSLGGEIVKQHRVASLDELPTASAYVLDVAPWNVGPITGDRLPTGYAQRLQNTPHGAAVFKLDYALSDPVPWRDPRCALAGTVHVAASDREVGAALAAVSNGAPPQPPFLISAQPSRFDVTRAPEGRHTFWVYGHVPFGWTGDLTDAIERQIERFAPGFRDTVLARLPQGPAALEARNANMIGGDISEGRFGGVRAFLRPVATRVPYATPNPSIFLCSSATPPGPGVHGMCGYHAARVVLRRVFGKSA